MSELVGMSYDCEKCGEEFQTLTRKRLHECPAEAMAEMTGGMSEMDSGLEMLKMMSGMGDDPEPTHDNQFAPDLDSGRELECMHCTETFPESAVVYEERFGDYLWWCPTEGCDGAGVGFDLMPTDEKTETSDGVSVSMTDVDLSDR